MKQNVTVGLTKRAVMITFFALGITNGSVADERFSGTLWETASGNGVEPSLLYAIALQESRLLDAGFARPDPYVIRDGSDVYRMDSYREAADLLNSLLSEGREPSRLKAIDVGMMQINLYWHGRRVEHLSELLIPAMNIWVGSEILGEALRSDAPSPQESVGRYHSWTPNLAVPYGTSVIEMACQIGWENSVCSGD